MLQQRLQLKETENHCLRKEIDGLKKDLRSQGSMTSSSEVRLNRALEEIERLKYNIKENKMELKVFIILVIFVYLTKNVGK